MTSGELENSSRTISEFRDGYKHLLDAYTRVLSAYKDATDYLLPPAGFTIEDLGYLPVSLMYARWATSASPQDLQTSMPPQLAAGFQLAAQHASDFAAQVEPLVRDLRPLWQARLYCRSWNLQLRSSQDSFSSEELSQIVLAIVNKPSSLKRETVTGSPGLETLANLSHYPAVEVGLGVGAETPTYQVPIWEAHRLLIEPGPLPTPGTLVIKDAGWQPNFGTVFQTIATSADQVRRAPESTANVVSATLATLSRS